MSTAATMTTPQAAEFLRFLPIKFSLFMPGTRLALHSILKRNLWPGSCHSLIQNRFLWLMTLVNRHVILREGIRKISGDDAREHTAKDG